MSVVSSDDAPEPLPSPLPLFSLFLTHWPATCSLFLLPITRSSVLCASCYMSMSLVIKNALWLSHVLVYWIKENPNIIVINTNNIMIHRSLQLHCWYWYSQYLERERICFISVILTVTARRCAVGWMVGCIQVSRGSPERWRIEVWAGRGWNGQTSRTQPWFRGRETPEGRVWAATCLLHGAALGGDWQRHQR